MIFNMDGIHLKVRELCFVNSHAFFVNQGDGILLKSSITLGILYYNMHIICTVG